MQIKMRFELQIWGKKHLANSENEQARICILIVKKLIKNCSWYLQLDHKIFFQENRPEKLKEELIEKKTFEVPCLATFFSQKNYKTEKKTTTIVYLDIKFMFWWMWKITQ